LITLVIYDISDDRDRYRLAELLKDYGLERIQYSGFKGELNPHDRMVLAKEVKKFVSGERDSVYIIPLCEKCASACKIISSSKRTLESEVVEVV